MPDVGSIAVVVPARDEAAHVDGCLGALAAAARRVAVPVRVVVVVNGTVDATARVARRWGVDVLEHETPGVGLARARGVERALRGADPRTTWVVSTDADSRVSPSWLTVHARLAADGADAVVGTVRLRPEDELRHAAWWRAYQRGVTVGDHHHVHGANLGVAGVAYLAVGGFRVAEAHEDASLVARLDDGGYHVVRTSEEPVVTSARVHGRAPHGVAADLLAARGLTG